MGLEASQIVLSILLPKCKEASQMVKLPLLASEMVLEGTLRGRGPYMTQEASLDALEKITF